MTRPILHTVSWDEDEPTAPGGGRIRYRVEAEGPDVEIGEECSFVNVAEESVGLGGVVYARDLLILNTRDLARMIQALIDVQAALHVAGLLAEGEKKP